MLSRIIKSGNIRTLACQYNDKSAGKVEGNKEMHRRKE